MSLQIKVARNQQLELDSSEQPYTRSVYQHAEARQSSLIIFPFDPGISAVWTGSGPTTFGN